MRDWSKYKIGSTVVVRNDAIKTLIDNGSSGTARENKEFVGRKGVITYMYSGKTDGHRIVDVTFGVTKNSWYLACLNLEDQREEMLDLESEL